MTDDLVEKVADAIAQHFSSAEVALDVHKDAARAALAAIESSGTHVVAPLNADGQMVGEWRQAYHSGHSLETCYFRMLAARPRTATGEAS